MKSAYSHTIMRLANTNRPPRMDAETVQVNYNLLENAVRVFIIFNTDVGINLYDNLNINLQYFIA